MFLYLNQSNISIPISHGYHQAWTAIFQGGICHEWSWQRLANRSRGEHQPGGELANTGTLGTLGQSSIHHLQMCFSHRNLQLQGIVNCHISLPEGICIYRTTRWGHHLRSGSVNPFDCSVVIYWNCKPTYLVWYTRLYDYDTTVLSMQMDI